MEELIKNIHAVAASILTKNKMFSQTMATKICNELVAAISMKTSASLDQKDVREIADKLIVNGNRGSLCTYLHHELFNRIIVRLKNTNAISCPFIINTGHKPRRELVTHFNEKLLADRLYVICIVRYLDEFKDCEGKYFVSPEIDMSCSFVASCILFSSIHFPTSYKSILTLKRDDVSHDYDFLKLFLPDEPVFYRYFLSPYSAIRLNRLKRYFDEHTTRENNHWNAKEIFPFSFELTDFPKHFKKWSSEIIQEMMDDPRAEGITISAFTKAARCEGVLDSYDQVNFPTSAIPFLHAVNCRKISSYSYHDYFLSYLIPDYPAGVYIPPQWERNKPYVIKNKKLEPIVDKIRKIRRAVETNKTLTKKEKEAEIEKIPSVVTELGSALSQHDLTNLKCFAEWIVQQYHAKTAIKTINNYASMLPSFIDVLSSMNKSVTTVNDEDMINVFKELKKHYTARPIRTRVKSFVDFVTAEYGSFVTERVWRIKETRMPERRTQQPFISYDHINRANETVLHFLASRQVPSRDEEKIRLRMKSPDLVHKAENMKHVYSIAFYTGTRREEALTLKVKSMRCRDELIMEIEKNKTSSSKRISPLHLLLPDDYLSEFSEYVHKREQKDGREAFLFTRESGEQWDTKEFIENIQDLFISLGIPDYVSHNNRSSFASWTLLRWFKVFHREKIPDGTPFLKYELFDDKYDDRFKKLFWGNYHGHKMPCDFTHANFVIARLLGHNGPIVSHERYIHTSDWLSYMLIKKDPDRNRVMTIKQAANLMQMSYSKMQRNLKGLNIKELSADVILEMQHDYLKNDWR